MLKESEHSLITRIFANVFLSTPPPPHKPVIFAMKIAKVPLPINPWLAKMYMNRHNIFQVDVKSQYNDVIETRTML